MSKVIEGFEDLDVWVKARALANSVCRICEEQKLQRNIALRDQMPRAAVSVISNVGEGFDRRPSKGRVQFFNIAKGSTGELRAQSHLAGDRAYISEQDVAELMTLTGDTSRLLGGLLRYMDTVVAREARQTKAAVSKDGNWVREPRAPYGSDIAPEEFDTAGYLAFPAYEQTERSVR